MKITTSSIRKNQQKKIGRLFKRARKPFAKYGFLALNGSLIVVVALFLIAAKNSAHQRTGQSNSQTANATSEVAALDEISSADIAVNIAQAARLPETSMVRNQADSRNILISIPVSEDVVVAKPQIVTDQTTGTQSRKDIAEYVAADGDTVSSIADKYSVSAESVKWSNGLSSDKIQAGTKLVLPPKNRTGLVYKPTSSDTIEKLADRYKTTADKIIAFNDLELTNTLPTDQYIFIPDGQKPPEPKATSNYDYFTNTFTARWGGNGYAAGFCTWWAAERRAQLGHAIPNNFGNAITWLAAAQSLGMETGTEPRAGAIIWYRFPDTSAGHVTIAESVNPDGSVNVSAMNDRYGGYGGWGIVSYYTIAASDLDKVRFIY